MIVLRERKADVLRETQREKDSSTEAAASREGKREGEGKREMTVDRLAKMEEAGSGREAD